MASKTTSIICATLCSAAAMYASYVLLGLCLAQLLEDVRPQLIPLVEIGTGAILLGIGALSFRVSFRRLRRTASVTSKRLLVIIVASVFISTLFVWRPLKPRFGAHFGFSLPATARLLNSHQDFSLESGYEFEFSATDDALRDAIIKDWNLKPASTDNNVMSFAERPCPYWWPEKRLGNLPERYGRYDQKTSEYWSLWLDRANGNVYAEHGNF